MEVTLGVKSENAARRKTLKAAGNVRTAERADRRHGQKLSARTHRLTPRAKNSGSMRGNPIELNLQELTAIVKSAL